MENTVANILERGTPLTTPGVPEQFEFRAILIIKNERVGKWSPTYTLTVG